MGTNGPAVWFVAVSVAAPESGISISCNIFADTTAIAAADYAPAIEAGSSVFINGIAVSVGQFAPDVYAGAFINPGTTGITVNLEVAEIDGRSPRTVILCIAS